MQILRVLQAGIDELLQLTVDFWHKLGEGKLFREGKLANTEDKTQSSIRFCQIFHFISISNLYHSLKWKDVKCLKIAKSCIFITLMSRFHLFQFRILHGKQGSVVAVLLLCRDWNWTVVVLIQHLPEDGRSQVNHFLRSWKTSTGES